MTQLELALSRLAFQFRDSANLKALLTAIATDFNDEDTAFGQLLADRYIETATGVQLDYIGEIVGLERPSDVDSTDYFGFLEDGTALGFTTLSDPSIGGGWYSLSAAAAPISDDRYRVLLKLKAALNSTSMTVEETISMVAFVYGVPIRYFQSPYTSFYPVYEINKTLTLNELAALDYFKDALGGGTSIYVQAPDNSFGFEGDDTALGFGSTTDSSVGGTFAIVVK